MSEEVLEKVTGQGVEVLFKRSRKPEKVDGRKTELIRYGDLVPDNMKRPDGETLKLIRGDGFSIELSKRRSTMPYWHRNMDYDEVIICISGEATWITEDGEFKLKAGEMLLIPRGIAHTASSSEDSNYVAIEVKSKVPLALVQR
ncbi:hypothetical protein HS1genome_0546 [Sulfodiicoccus acidiphilus]|uniref:Cupin type-2 domain-containing protein n=1 Tax=Sulfodiicoccus acidiphilus TaxID=1670455 RepID=A0A348B1V5_9CREN|nr:cupin domain-containing protein [Sulfodiicoccus acidiphilus]BBD72157.1 hypothetical protein HS1genome_0546 [Sulfodiicoccus acidiphilus]GGT94595.1 hypothetical protein GCM10007116_10240 [Sulfodiicoccus acidiphilus]